MLTHLGTLTNKESRVTLRTRASLSIYTFEDKGLGEGE
jgi:hypothetical protein